MTNYYQLGQWNLISCVGSKSAADCIEVKSPKLKFNVKSSGQQLSSSINRFFNQNFNLIVITSKFSVNILDTEIIYLS